jgi:NAD(P)-dependent dehydrogenase (short-subunit alcohol dehydrogenase family)
MLTVSSNRKLDPTRERPVPESARPVAIVTGGSRGIGAAVADALAAAGLAVASFDLRDQAGPPSGDDDRLGLTVDVSRAEQVQAGVAAVAERFGRIDVLVNNAGILACHAVHDTPASDRPTTRAITW